MLATSDCTVGPGHSATERIRRNSSSFTSCSQINSSHFPLGSFGVFQFAVLSGVLPLPLLSPAQMLQVCSRDLLSPACIGLRWDILSSGFAKCSPWILILLSVALSVFMWGFGEIK